MANKKIWKKLLPGLLLVAISAAVGMTGATVLHNVSLENPIKTPPVTGTIEENVENNVKMTRFKNTSNDADVFLRVSYGESWTLPITDAAGNVTGNELLPLQFTAADGVTYRVATPVWNSTTSDDWEMGDDGWIYYKHVLKAGKETPVLLYKVNFLGTADSPVETVENAEQLTALDPLGSKYLKAHYDIHFTMEVVQASDEWQVSKDAVKELFGETASGVITADLKVGELPNGKDKLNKEKTLSWPGIDETWKWEPCQLVSKPTEPNP